MDSVRALLHRIAVDREFALLESLRCSSVWNSWSIEARHALALLFAEYAATSLKGASSEETFTLAETLAPNCPLVATRRAVMLASKHDDINQLTLAHAAFQQAYALDPEGSLTSWELWADTLRRLSALQNESQFAVEALAYYKKARACTDNKKTIGRISYHEACCHILLAEISQEASEASLALEMLKLAKEAHFDPLAVQLLEAEGLSILSKLLQNKELARRALQHAVVASNMKVKQITTSQERLCHRLIAMLASTLYKETGESALFALAYQHFDIAIRIDPKCSKLRLECALFLLFAGKFCGEITLAQESLLHFLHADIPMKQASEELCCFAEAELLAGSENEDLELMASAEQKILVCLEQDPHSSRFISLYAALLIEFGNYFTDNSYYEKALVCLGQALSAKPNDPDLWHACGLTYLTFGEQSRDSSLLQKACHAYGKVIESHGKETLDLYHDYALAWLRIGELEESTPAMEQSVRLFEQAIKLGDQQELGGQNPTEAYLDCLYNYGCALDLLGDCLQEISHYEKAIHILSTVLIASPGRFHVRYNLAICLAHLGEAAGEIEPLRKSLELFSLLTQDDREDEAAWQEWGVALMHLAELLNDPGRPQESQNLLQEAESKLLHAASLGNPRAYYYLACAYSLSQNSDVALYYLQRAAQEKCLPDPDQLLEEEWLDHLHSLPGFHALLEQLSSDKNELD